MNQEKEAELIDIVIIVKDIEDDEIKQVSIRTQLENFKIDDNSLIQFMDDIEKRLTKLRGL